MQLRRRFDKPDTVSCPTRSERWRQENDRFAALSAVGHATSQ